MVLQNAELKNTYGGANTGLFFSIAGAVVFVIGIIDGFLRPLKCK